MEHGKPSYRMRRGLEVEVEGRMDQIVKRPSWLSKRMGARRYGE